MSYFDIDWAPRFDFGGPRSTNNLVGVAVHTSEGGGLSTTAEALANYQLRARNGSYHVIVDARGVRLRCNTDDWIVWGTGNKGNNILNHICFTARASMTRNEWLAQERMLRAGASVVAHWCKRYGWPARKITAAGLPGILGHADTRVWGGTDHTDPGVNFPYDVFTRYVTEAMSGASSGSPAPAPTPTPKPVPNLINEEAEVAKAWIGERKFKEERDAIDGGKYADFEGGSIYWHPDRTWLDNKPSAIAVPAHIYETWERYDWERGFLGYPVRRHTVIKDEGDIQAFEKGVIYRKYGTEGFPVRGVIGDRWFREGAQEGRLGWPISDEQDRDGGKVQRFENGELHWHPSGAVEVIND